MARFVDKYLSIFVIVAIIAVIVSRRSSTAAVLQSLASAMSNILGSIVSPISNGTAKSASPKTGMDGPVMAPTGDEKFNTLIPPAIQPFMSIPEKFQ